jgi:hypothetical protein
VIPVLSALTASCVVCGDVCCPVSAPICPACREEGRSRLLVVPGILIAIRGSSLDVERCDACALYETDAEATQAVVDAIKASLLGGAK